MTPRIIDMKGNEGSFYNEKIEGFEGMGRVEFIGQCEHIGADGQLNATAIDHPDNFIQVRGVGNEETPWVFLRKDDRFFFPEHKALEFRYQAKSSGVVYLLTGPVAGFNLSGKGA